MRTSYLPATRAQWTALALVGTGIAVLLAVTEADAGAAIERHRLAFAVGAGALAWTGALWYDRQTITSRLDERAAQILYRSTWYGFWAAIALLATMSFTVEAAGEPRSASMVIAVALGGGLLAFLGALAYHERVM